MYEQELQQRFWSRINKTDTCWPWTGATDSNGYAILKSRGKTVFAQRVSYELINGPIPKGYFVHRSCNMQHCVNPDHLYIDKTRGSKQHKDKLRNQRIYGHKASEPVTLDRYTELFWSKVNKTDNCWIWTDRIDYKGYGRCTASNNLRTLLSISTKTPSAHRISYLITFGLIPDGLLVCHKCDTPACVNPEHLFLGTYSDNYQDMIQKGRQAKGKPKRFRKLPLQDELIRLRQSGLSAKAIAEMYNVTPASVNGAIRYKYKS